MARLDYDILIVGGGHAGIEAARIASRMNMKVGLVTMDRNNLALMSCNPAVGGVGKGHLVREVDALGGVIGMAADFAGIQFRRLNMSKGPAVRSTRIQCDRRRYTEYVNDFVVSLPNVEVIEGEAIGLIIENNRVKGCEINCTIDSGHQDANRCTFLCGTVILATGTFLGGLIHIGNKAIQSGRRGEPAAIGMTESLKQAGFETGRLKTGTPPRINGKTIDYSKTEAQPGHEPPPRFAHFIDDDMSLCNDSLCHLTYTTEETARIIRDNIDRAPLFSGQIQGTGPRYCPSIEDKIVRFAEKPRHQIFIEPEGNGTDEIYLNGFATSLPEDVQQLAVQSIIGLENAVITQPGYAIEYDYVPPYQIKASLETHNVSGLYMAGQINGTSGYEEAAAQGLIAGLNASLQLRDEDPFIPGRHESYIGVMLDDLVTRNISEPYRMFTSRAEYRLALREDNALDRLAAYGIEYGIYSDSELTFIDRQEGELRDMISYLKSTRINSAIIKGRYNLQTKRGSLSLADLACRPDFDPQNLFELSDNGLHDQQSVFEKAVILIKYKGYLEKQNREIERHRKNETITIPESVDYRRMSGLKTEALEKLERFRPRTIGQASRIEGVTPSDIAVLTIHLKGK
jgi:tRNA uridine 5-carboxymethylaminomethyl modification enzyme